MKPICAICSQDDLELDSKSDKNVKDARKIEKLSDDEKDKPLFRSLY